MNSKERAYLKGLAMKLDPIFQVGKGRISPQLTDAISEALEANELIKISVLNNCLEDPKSIAETLGERTGAEVVQVIGKKIVLFRPSRTKKRIDLKNRRKYDEAPAAKVVNKTAALKNSAIQNRQKKFDNNGRKKN